MRPSARSRIESTFRQLINKKSIDKMTVTEICQISHINRQTFYNHFIDLFDIYKCLFEEEIFAEIAQNRTYDTWEGGFMATMQYLHNNTDLVMHVYNSSYRWEAVTFFNEISSRLLENVLRECMKRKSIDLTKRDCDFIVNFYRHVFVGLMMDWVNEGMKEKPDLLLRKLKVMIDGSILKSVELFSDEERYHWEPIFHKESK